MRLKSTCKPRKGLGLFASLFASQLSFQHIEFTALRILFLEPWTKPPLKNYVTVLQPHEIDLPVECSTQNKSCLDPPVTIRHEKHVLNF